MKKIIIKLFILTFSKMIQKRLFNLMSNFSSEITRVAMQPMRCNIYNR